MRGRRSFATRTAWRCSASASHGRSTCSWSKGRHGGIGVDACDIYAYSEGHSKEAPDPLYIACRGSNVFEYRRLIDSGLVRAAVDWEATEGHLMFLWKKLSSIISSARCTLTKALILMMEIPGVFDLIHSPSAGSRRESTTAEDKAELKSNGRAGARGSGSKESPSEMAGFFKGLEKVLSNASSGGGAGGRGGRVGGGFSSEPEICRKWANTGSCHFGNGCRWVSSHTQAPSAEGWSAKGSRAADKEKRGKSKKSVRIRSPPAGGAGSDSDSD